MISEEIIQRIKDENDIVNVVSETVKLKKAGRNYLGLCPFHHEKTPSFSVSQEKQIYKCFGCGEVGNSITFIMKTKNLPFIESVKYLAEKANINIEPTYGTENPKIKEKNIKLYEINTEAAKFYFKNLQGNKKIIEYFIKRGLVNKTIRKFGLGYAEEGWKNLIFYLKKKGYTELDLLNAGLIIKGNNNSFYDRFRNRVIFPVFDIKGRVIGFGGRVLDDSKPKYLNSPETEVFKKGINLYALNFAIKENKDRAMIIVEGYMDCISLHQYGITNVVASLGTALTVEQAKLLKRYADKIIISYDSDLAGQSATSRGLEILRKEGFEIKVLILPEGKDPDEYIRNNGKEAFLALINNSIPFLEYKIKAARSGINLRNKEMMIKYMEKVCEIVSDLDPIERDVYIKKASEETGIKEQAIYDLLNEKNKKNVNKLKKTNIMDKIGQNLYLEPAYIKAERNLLKMMLENINNYTYVIENINEDNLILDAHKKIFSLIKQFIDKDVENISEHIEANCNTLESSKEWISIQHSEVLYGDNYRELIRDYIREIKKSKLEESKKEIMIKIKEYEDQGLFEESLRLVKELDLIQKAIMEISLTERR